MARRQSYLRRVLLGPVVRRRRPVPPPVRSIQAIPPSPRVIALARVLHYGQAIKQRRAAALALGRLGPRAMGAIRVLVATLRLPMFYRYQSTTALKRTAIWALGQMGAHGRAAVPALLWASANSSLNQAARGALARIVKNPIAVWPALVAALRNHRNRTASVLAMQMLGSVYLGERRNRALVPVLLPIYKLNNYAGMGQSSVLVYQLKNAASWLLGRLGQLTPGVVRCLLGAMGNSLTAVAARAALDRLLLEASVHRLRGVVALLTQTLKTGTMDARIYAARHLGYLGPSALPALVPLAQACRVTRPYLSAGKLRKYAAIALGEIGPAAKPAVGVLFGLVDDASAGSFARRALGQILRQPGQHVALLTQALAARKLPLWSRLYALSLLRKVGASALKAAMPALLSSLTPAKANGLQLRHQVVLALSSLGLGALPGLATLRAALAIQKKVPTSASFRMAVLVALAKMGPKARSAVPDIMRSFGDFSEVMYVARRALDQILTTPVPSWAVLRAALKQKRGAFLRVYAAKQMIRLVLEPGLLQGLSASQKQGLLASLHQTSLAPAHIWAGAYYWRALDGLRQRRHKAALLALEHAIKRGFDDHLEFCLNRQWTPLHRHPRFLALYGKLRISAADRHELFWLKTEQRHISHETRMMIIEQIGRKDDGWTVVPQSVIPSHGTRSVGVLLARILARRLQTQQKYRILQADIQRKHHLVTMGILTMNSRRSYAVRSAYRLAKLRSMRLARQRALERRRRVLARRYKPLVGASRLPAPAPAFQPQAPPKLRTPAQRLAELLRHAGTLTRQKKWTQALAALHQIVQLKPLPTHIYNRASVYMQLKRWEAAAVDMRWALRLAPRNFIYHIDYSHVLFMQRKLAAAAQVLHRSLQIAGRHKLLYYAYNNLASVFVHQGQFTRAFAMIERAYKLNSTRDFVIANRAYIALRLRRFKIARSMLQRGGYLASKLPFFHYVRACALAASGRYGDAIELLRGALSMGFSQFALLPKEPSLAPLRQLPAFRRAIRPYLP